MLYDVEPAAIERGRERIRRWPRRVAPAKLDLDAESTDDWVDGRLARAAPTRRPWSRLATEAELVIEAALEDLELKRAIFRALDARRRPAT